MGGGHADNDLFIATESDDLFEHGSPVAHPSRGRNCRLPAATRPYID